MYCSFGGIAVAKITFRDAKPSDPMYKEGPQSYSPHWGRALLKSKSVSQQNTDGECVLTFKNLMQPFAHDQQRTHLSVEAAVRDCSEMRPTQYEYISIEVKGTDTIYNKEQIVDMISQLGTTIIDKR
jgi:hypothetical protein